MVKVMVRVRNINPIGRHVLLHDVPRAAPQADALALADRVKPIPTMCRQGLPALQFHDFALPFDQVIPDKLGILDLAQKTDSLAVFAVAVGQVPLPRQSSDFAFAQVTDREPQPTQLRLVERAQEIGLVLDRVRRSFEQAYLAALLHLRVVSADDFVEARPDLLQEQPELDPLVAPDVRARGPPRPKLFHGGGDDPFLVFALEGNDVQRDATLLAYRPRVLQILLPGTTSQVGQLVFEPDLQIKCADVPALALL